MKKYLFSAFFLLSFVFLGLNTTTTSSIAEECHTTSDGKVIIQNTNGQASVPADAKPLSIDGGTSFVEDGCMVSPLFYRMEGYTILLCISDPYISDSTPDLTVCPATIVSRIDSDPKIIEIPLGEEVDMLDGEELVLPIGVYSHAVFIGSNHLAVKHNVEFVRDDNGGAFTMDGFNSANGGPEDGVKCWTVKDAATTYNNISASSHTNAAGTSRDFTAPTPGAEESLGLTCGANIITAAGDTQEYGYQFEIIDSMGGSGDFVAFDDYAADKYATGTESAFVLLQSSGVKATTRANAKKIAYIAHLETPLFITENTIGFKIDISTNATVSLDVHRSGENPQTLEAKKMGVDPFGVRFQTKTRRTRGAWR